MSVSTDGHIAYGVVFDHIRCLVYGHRCEATGRHGHLLHEWRCLRCGGVFVSHVDYGSLLIPADKDSDQIFERSNGPDTQP